MSGGSRIGTAPDGGLRAFRARLHGCFGRRADALFELTDAILTAGRVPSAVHLCLAAVHRRGWGSLYGALSRGQVDAEALEELLATHRPDEGETAVYAVDVSPWPRCDAEARPGRGYLYHPSRHSAGQPIVAGWAYQLVVGLYFERGSWVTPVDARRVNPDEDANDVAVEQVRDLGRLPWERPLAPRSLTPTRVLRNFASLLPALGTPAEAPKPRGRSPGRPKGRLSGPAKRYSAVKKAA